MQNFPEYESFRHGLVVSKIWLCEELEKICNKLNYRNPTVYSLAAWHNILSFMMIVRKPDYYKEFYGYDINPLHTEAANKLCETWNIENPKVINHTQDINQLNYEYKSESVFINCSVDQLDGDIWYKNIPNGSLVCLQTTNLDIPEHPWYIKTVTKTPEELSNKFPVSNLLFLDKKVIDYKTWGYDRLMMIGIK